jgi:hypothetical protein
LNEVTYARCHWQAAYLSATVTMPPMKRNQANAWIAFLLECRGQRGCRNRGRPENPISHQGIE